MAHKTLIGGTAYEISGGKTLVNGTAYSIDKGKTLVGGTAYEVGFAEMVQVTLKTSYGPKAIASINGENINLNVASVDSTYDVPVGAGIVFINNSKARGDVKIVHGDGTTTTYNINANGGSFSYAVIGKTEVIASATNRDYGPSMYEPNTPVITITEIPEGQITFIIANSRYFADEGMTWGEWVNSTHNTGGYQIQDTLICNSNGNMYVVDTSVRYVAKDELIEMSGSYYISR